MAGQEREISGRQAELLLKGTAAVEMIIGAGLALIPGLGVAGAFVVVIGAAGFAFVEHQKNKKHD